MDIQTERPHFDYHVAQDLDHAWLNFEANIPLVPLPFGETNPFYVERPGNPIAQLQDELLAPFYSPPKRFFSGHRGCGKSTELYRLASHPEILAKYYPLHFTIRDEADINNLDYKDVLLAVGRQIYQQYRDKGGELPEQLEKELDAWRGKIEQEFIRSSRLAGFEVEGGIDALAAKFGVKMKLEPETRRILRQIIEPNISGLVNVINLIATGILAKEKRTPLVLIDDLDKPDFPTAREIFYHHRVQMLQPNCAIVYTIASSLFYNPEFAPIKDLAKFLPNIRLHAPRSKTHDETGFATLRGFVARRMNLDLIAADALDEAIHLGGGVFSETARIIRASARRARNAGHIEREHVHSVKIELQNEYRRIIRETKWWDVLVRVHRTCDTKALDEEEANIAAILLQMLAILEYNGDGTWWDVHPALLELVEDYESSRADPN